MAAAKEDLDDLIGKKASGGVAAAIAAAQGGSPARSPSRKGGSVAAAIVAAQGSPPATSQPSASPAGPPDESSPSPSTAAESPAKPAPIAPPAREAKGFLLSARRAPSPRAARPPPQEEEDAVEDEPEAESSPEAGAAKEAVPTNTHLSGNARPNKRQGIGKNADGTPRKPSTPKSSTPSKGSKAKGSKSASSSPSAESVSESGPMISRRPGASQNLMPTLSTASIGGGPPGPFEEEEEEEDVQQYGTVPQMWQESLAPKGAAEDLSNEVNVTVKSPKQSRLSRLTGGKKQKKAAKFVPKARLAYYGTIGGGFGTPRLGFAAGQFNTPTWSEGALTELAPCRPGAPCAGRSLARRHVPSPSPHASSPCAPHSGHSGLRRPRRVVDVCPRGPGALAQGRPRCSDHELPGRAFARPAGGQAPTCRLRMSCIPLLRCLASSFTGSHPPRCAHWLPHKAHGP